MDRKELRTRSSEISRGGNVVFRRLGGQVMELYSAGRSKILDALPQTKRQAEQQHRRRNILLGAAGVMGAIGAGAGVLRRRRAQTESAFEPYTDEERLVRDQSAAARHRVNTGRIENGTTPAEHVLEREDETMRVTSSAEHELTVD